MLNPSIDFPSPSRQRGASLIELMVGMVVGLLIIIAAAATYLTTSLRVRDTLNAAKLNMTLRTTMDVVVDEIRRAGYSASGGVNNPFTNRNPGSFSDLIVTNNGSCIEFSYDMNADGLLANSSPFEYSGFRVQNGILSMRNGGPGIVNNCTNGSWEALTDANQIIIIPHSNGNPYFTVTYQCMNTQTSESDNEACTGGGTVFDQAAAGKPVDLLETRTVSVNLGARLASDNSMRMDLSQQVLVRNHRVVVAGTP